MQSNIQNGGDHAKVVDAHQQGGVPFSPAVARSYRKRALALFASGETVRARELALKCLELTNGHYASGELDYFSLGDAYQTAGKILSELGEELGIEFLISAVNIISLVASKVMPPPGEDFDKFVPGRRHISVLIQLMRTHRYLGQVYQKQSETCSGASQYARASSKAADNYLSAVSLAEIIFYIDNRRAVAPKAREIAEENGLLSYTNLADLFSGVYKDDDLALEYYGAGLACGNRLLVMLAQLEEKERLAYEKCARQIGNTKPAAHSKA
jgi:hypothetical protein